LASTKEEQAFTDSCASTARVMSERMGRGRALMVAMCMIHYTAVRAGFDREDPLLVAIFKAIEELSVEISVRSNELHMDIRWFTR